jgi:hypothetical protein
MSSYTGGHTSGLSPDAVATEIDGVAFEKHQRTEQPGYVSAQNSFFFMQDTSNLLAYTWDEDSNVGGFDETDEQETIANTDTRIGNTKTKRQQKWTKQVPVSIEAFKADAVGKRAKIGSQIGERARTTQDKASILNTYADAFAGAKNTTPDGQAFASNSHVTLKNVTVDNLETGALNADNLWIVVQSLANQKAQDGEAGSYVFEGLLVPFILYKTAKEVMDSSLVPFSAENQINLFDTVYGTVNIGASIFLGSAFNSNSNANTSYHALSSSHMVTRQTFMNFNTDLIDPTKTDNDSWVYRGRFMEAHFMQTFSGYVGSNGTTA